MTPQEVLNKSYQDELKCFFGETNYNNNFTALNKRVTQKTEPNTGVLQAFFDGEPIFNIKISNGKMEILRFHDKKDHC